MAEQQFERRSRRGGIFRHLRTLGAMMLLVGTALVVTSVPANSEDGPMGTLDVSVLTADGEGIPGAYISAYLVVENGVSSRGGGQTGADGHLAVEVPVGDYKVGGTVLNTNFQTYYGIPNDGSGQWPLIDGATALTVTEGATVDVVFHTDINALTVLSSPTIDGAPKTGQTLTGTPAEFFGDVTVSNQWLADGEPIDGATGETLELTSEQVGKAITFQTTGSAGGKSETSTSEAIGPVEEDIPFEATTPPVITGTAKVGETLTGTSAEFSTAPDYTIQAWLVGDEVMGTSFSGTPNPLEITDAMVGKQIKLRTTGGKGMDSVDSVSEAIGPVVAAGSPLEVTTPPSITGTAKVGETLTGTPAVFAGDPDTVANQWLADGAPIDGATDTTLMLAAAQQDKVITFKSTATKGDETPLDSTSEAVGPVVAASASLAVTSKPTITGTAEVGKTLTGTPAVFTGGPDSVINQWLAGGTPIAGANGTTLKLEADQVGKAITFRSLAVKGEESLPSISDPTAAVIGEATDPSDPDEPSDPSGSKEDLVTLSSKQAQPGDEITVAIDQMYAGQDVAAWLFSTPTSLGTHTVSNVGKFSVTIPDTIAPGSHRLAVYDAQNQLIGWAGITVAGSTTPVLDEGGRDVGGLGGYLPATGAPEWWTGLAGLVLLLAGAGAVGASSLGREKEEELA